MKQELYENLLNVTAAFYGIEALERKIAKTREQRNKVQNIISQKRWNAVKKKVGKACLIWGIILLYFPIGFTYGLIIAPTYPIGWIGLPISLIPCIFLISSYIRKRKKESARALKALAEAEEYEKTEGLPAVAGLEEEIHQLEASKTEFIEGTRSLIEETLPPKYRTLDASCFMLEAVKNQRADHMMALTNLYEEELFRRGQLQILSNSVEMQRIHNENMAFAMNEVLSNQQVIQGELSEIKALEYANLFNS